MCVPIIFSGGYSVEDSAKKSGYTEKAIQVLSEKTPVTIGLIIFLGGTICWAASMAGTVATISKNTEEIKNFVNEQTKINAENHESQKNVTVLLEQFKTLNERYLEQERRLLRLEVIQSAKQTQIP